MRVGPDAAQFGYDYLNPTAGVMPKVRADAVDALNSIRAKAASPWTAESLFLFFAAFIRTDSELHCDWARPTGEILALLTRGMNRAQRDDVATVLAVAMSEVPEMIQLVPSSQINAQPSPGRGSTGTVALFCLFPFGLAVSAIAAGAKELSNYRDEKRDLAILRKIAESLSQGGLSTIECRAVLLEQGLPKDVVFKALQFT